MIKYMYWRLLKKMKTIFWDEKGTRLLVMDCRKGRYLGGVCDKDTRKELLAIG